jgi:HSP20 family protein
MKLVPYKPFSPAKIDQFFSDFFDRDLGSFFGSDFYDHTPSVNVREDEKAYTLEVAAPGLEKEDFSVEVKDDQLIISAEKKVEREDQNDQYTRREFNFSSFQRVFTLPEGIEGEKIEAKYDRGLLQIVLSRKEMEVLNKRTIEIG